MVPVAKHHAMKTYGGVEVWLHSFLLATAALDGDEWPASHLGRSTPGERVTDTH
jgi:hypothetical protein